MSHPTPQSKSRYAAARLIQAAATLLNTATITGNEVFNMKNEKLGKIQDVVVDITDGQILYAVLASGGFLGVGDRLIAVPWKALKKDKEKNRFILDADVERLKNSPDFYKDRCPDVADVTWNSTVEPYHARRSPPPGG